MAKPRKNTEDKAAKLTVTIPPELMALIQTEADRDERPLSYVVTKMLQRASGDVPSVQQADRVDELRHVLADALEQQTDRYVRATEEMGSRIATGMAEGFNSLGKSVEQVNRKLAALPAGQLTLGSLEAEFTEEEQDSPVEEPISRTEPEIIAGAEAPKRDGEPDLVDRLERYLKRDGISMKQFQDRHGFGISNKAGWRNGSKKMSQEMRNNICKILDDAGL